MAEKLNRVQMFRTRMTGAFNKQQKTQVDTMRDGVVKIEENMNNKIEDLLVLNIGKGAVRKGKGLGMYRNQ